jgi:hypothetical protein
MGNKKGGGRATNAPTAYFTGNPSTRINERGVSQIGSSMGNHATDAGKVLRGQPEAVRGSGIGPLGEQRLGDEVAQSTQCGVGGGQQAAHGPLDRDGEGGMA